ncbi:U32 family peptidase [Hespellia stercorisuis]|uniref:Putative protease n=1 Tax=Hespellia stercorisuis DSM 15480 TaxID=1121950 RepID=A0A1M6HGT2_9FIRM|nr:U32 family peptidase [Hespellia stercorisuis]SHJ21375.1 putative protease [Hespellia stercorisuis DSM 15480]
MKSQIEVLAPAGSFESFKAAIAAGADAVYVGGSLFGARAYAENFSEEQMLAAIDYAHLHGRKIFLTVNTLLKDDEIREHLYEYLLPYYCQGLDAVIVQDVGVLEFVSEHFPGMAIHASTQMTITNALGARLMKEKGVERVVTARELNLEEIHEIAVQTGLEIECFVHGALCYCYSGQCLFSSFIGGRSGNRGQCAQPCRLPYEAEKKKGYLLSLKDICTLDGIPDMIEAGIYSFKIEGRMKKPEYVAAVTAMYRKYVDLYFSVGKKAYHVDPKDKEYLMDIYNRGGFDDGYYHKHNGAEMISTDRPNHAGVKAFQVLSQKGREIKGRALTDIGKGDILELSCGKDNYTFGQPLKKGETFTLIGPKGKRFAQGTILNRTRNQRILDEVRESYIGKLLQRPIRGTLTLKVGSPAQLELETEQVKICCEGSMVEEAKNQPLEETRILKQMKKTGNSDFFFCEMCVQTEGALFLPMQKLNELRRQGMELLAAEITEQYRRTCAEAAAGERPEPVLKLVEDDCTIKNSTTTSEIRLHASAETKEQLQAIASCEEVSRVYMECNMFSHVLTHPQQALACVDALQNAGKEVFFAMPHIFRKEAVAEYDRFYETFCRLAVDGALIRNYESFQFLKDHGYDRKMILDHNLYVFNHDAKTFWEKLGVMDCTAPVELNFQELKTLETAAEELIVYGYLPMMVSAGCVKRTTTGCDRQSGILTIKDRYQKNFSVKNYCEFCYNIIYNLAPLALLDQMQEIRVLGPRSVRLNFTLESSGETENVLMAFAQALAAEKESRTELGQKEFTRGHFKRGIK